MSVISPVSIAQHSQDMLPVDRVPLSRFPFDRYPGGHDRVREYSMAENRRASIKFMGESDDTLGSISD